MLSSSWAYFGAQVCQVTGVMTETMIVRAAEVAREAGEAETAAGEDYWHPQNVLKCIISVSFTGVWIDRDGAKCPVK